MSFALLILGVIVGGLVTRELSVDAAGVLLAIEA
jgi:hypothetical protein